MVSCECACNTLDLLNQTHEKMEREQVLDGLETELNDFETQLNIHSSLLDSYAAANSDRLATTNDPLLRQVLEDDNKFIAGVKAKVQRNRDKLDTMKELLRACRDGTITLEKLQETRVLLEFSNLKVND
jgi:hypothetical protein